MSRVKNHKLFGASVALAAGGAMVSLGAPAAHATVAADSVVLTQASKIDRIAGNHVLSAQVTSGGVNVADGTPVQFHATDFVLSDHLYGGLALDNSGSGYWMAAFNGAVRAFGDATNYGGPTLPANDGLVAIANDPQTSGYWLLDEQGHVWNEGNAPKEGTGTVTNSDPNAFPMALTSDPAGNGLWVLWSDNTVSTVGSAPDEGPTPNVSGQNATTLVAAPNGDGYWVVYDGGDIRAVGSGMTTLSDFSGVPQGDYVTSASTDTAGDGLFGLTAGGTVVATGNVTKTSDLVDTNTYYDVAIAALPSGTGYFGLGADGQILTGGAAVAPAYRDAWSALTSGGVANLAITGTLPGESSAYASAGGTNSSVVSTEWSEPPGYWLAASGGGVFAKGAAPFFGSPRQYGASTPTTSMAATPDGLGYWVLTSGGGVYSFGSATYAGNAIHRDSTPFVGIAGGQDDASYMMVARDGQVITQGDTPYGGSALGYTTSAVGIAADPNSGGYWVVSSNGGVFALGGAGFFGSAAHISKAPIVALYPTYDGGGYWLVNSVGSVFAFGDAGYVGSATGHAPSAIVGLAGNPQLTDGYWLAASQGSVLPYGSALDAGSITAGTPVVAITPDSGFFTEFQLFSRASRGRSHHTAAQRLAAWRHLGSIRG